MNEPVRMVMTGLAGSGLGAIFFGGLWWTVRRGVSAEQPALWFLGSLLLRMGLALAGFYFLTRGHPGRLLACLVGFALARPAVTWLTRRLGDAPTRTPPKVGHAP